MVYYRETTKTDYIIGVTIVHKELLLIVLTTSKMADSEGNLFNVREFSEVILTLQNVLLPQEKLSPTPSMLDGLDSETEMDLRILGCELIQTSGILLKLPQVRYTTRYHVVNCFTNLHIKWYYINESVYCSSFYIITLIKYIKNPDKS